MRHSKKINVKVSHGGRLSGETEDLLLLSLIYNDGCRGVMLPSPLCG